MLFDCNRCGKPIGLNEGYISITYNIEQLNKNLTTLQDEIEVKHSDQILTLCGKCGNQFQASAMKEHLRTKETVYDQDVIESHITRLLQSISLETRGVKEKEEFIFKIASDNGITSEQFEKILRNVNKKQVAIPSNNTEKIKQICELIDMLFKDGGINPDEIDFIRSVSKSYGVSDQYIADMIMKESVFRNMVAIAMADGKATDEELGFIKAILSKTTLDNKINRERIFNFNPKQYATYIPQKKEHKLMHMRMFADLALIDGNLNLDAVKLIRNLGTQAYGLLDEEVMEIIYNKTEQKT